MQFIDRYSDDLWYVLVALAWAGIIATLSGCGALPGGDESHAGARAWCCEVEALDGTVALECSIREKLGSETCICAGEQIFQYCMDPTKWEPGTACTDSPLICYEAI